MSTYARATFGFDSEHRRELADAITATIFAYSRVSDCEAAMLRTGEMNVPLRQPERWR